MRNVSEPLDGRPRLLISLASATPWVPLCGNDACKRLYTRLFPGGKKLCNLLIQEFLVGRTPSGAGRVSP